MNRTRTGFMRCSGLKGPSGAHHSRENLANLAASARFTVDCQLVARGCCWAGASRSGVPPPAAAAAALDAAPSCSGLRPGSFFHAQHVGVQGWLRRALTPHMSSPHVLPVCLVYLALVVARLRDAGSVHSVRGTVRALLQCPSRPWQRTSRWALGSIVDDRPPGQVV